MLLGGHMTEFQRSKYLPLLPIASYSTGFGFPIIHLSRKPHPSQMRLMWLIIRLQERKVVGRKTRKTSFALFTAISEVSTRHLCAWGSCVDIRQVMVLIGYAKQATSEGKSGPVEPDWPDQWLRPRHESANWELKGGECLLTVSIIAEIVNTIWP